MKKNVIFKRVEKGFYKVYDNTGFLMGFIEKVNSHKWDYMHNGFWEEPVKTLKEAKEIFAK